MSTVAIEQEIVELERKYWEALRNKDLATARRLTDDPSIVTGPQGIASLNPAQFAQMFKSDQWTLNDFQLEDIEARAITDDVAVIGYKVTEQMTVEGKPVTLKAADASTWVRRDGRWVCALHTESILGDPFGRDRKGA